MLLPRDLHEGEPMKIEEAFTQDAIEAMGVDLENELEETAVREMVPRIWAANDLGEIPEGVAGVCLLFFVAGRTYQADDVKINLSVSPSVVADFLEYQSRRGRDA